MLSAPQTAPARTAGPRDVLTAYLSDCRALVLDAIRDMLPPDAPYRPVLYDLMLEYPLREAKALRPALCIAACRALGGQVAAALPSAAVLELFHNAFLIHDDIEDGSELRRGAPTLHRAYGIPVAVNVGDAMFALALGPLLENTHLIGLGKALRVLETVARMCRESVEGQALELDWMRTGAFDLTDDDYVRMVEKKTGWYTFIAPVRLGCIAAGCPLEQMEELSALARSLGTAFQIQDDILNLDERAEGYGKELAGDLWEGKRTLILLHALRGARPDERAEALRILAKPRPAVGGEPAGPPDDLLDAMERAGELTAAGRRRLVDTRAHRDAAAKTDGEVAFLLALVRRRGSLERAAEIARRFGDEADARLAAACAWLPPSVHRDFLEELVAYAHTRDR